MTDVRILHQSAAAGSNMQPDRSLTTSQLSLSELEQVQLLETEFERERKKNPKADLAAKVLEADVELRPLLLQQLLRVEITSRQAAGAPPPTLAQLGAQYPTLEALLPAAYHRLDAKYRVPDVLGGYQLEQIIGAGAQGFVASAHLVVLPDIKAVIKYAKHGQSADRIHQEARFLSLLRGRGVPSVINKGIAADGTAFLVMETLQGHNLDDFLNKEAMTSRGLLWAAKILRQLALTLDEIHAAKILHRDLKPSNLFVEAGDRLRIIDFGLAVDMNSGFGPRPPVFEFHGTPAYQAPEQLAADPEVEGRLSDIFAVGRILLACLAGSDAVIAAYVRENSDTALATDALAPPVKIASRQLARIQAKAAHLDPAQRYQSASALAHDLGRYLRKQQGLRWLQWGGLSGAAALIVLAVVMMFLPAASPPTVKEDLSVEGVSLSPEFRENLNRENLMLALSRGDVSTLKDYERRQAPVDLYESALDATRIGESRSVAQHFLASCKERPQALAWLERALAAGMDPNLVVPATANPRESLLGVAWTENNVAAMHLLLKSGATPHVYQQLTGWKWDAPRMLFPLDNLMRSKGFTPQEIDSLASAFLAAGVVLPEPIPDLKTSKQNRQTEIIERQLAALRERYELDVGPNPDLWVRRESAFAERATQRTGKDWNRLLREIPLLLTAHEDETIGLAFGTLGPIKIQYLLGIMEGKAYFQASSSKLYRPTYLIAETDERGQIWRLYIYGSSSLRAMGAPRIDPADQFPENAWDSWYWRYYDGKYDTSTRIMEFQCTDHPVKYVGLHTPEEVEANRQRQRQKKAEERKQQEKLAEEARQEEKKFLEEWRQEKQAEELRLQEQKAEKLRQRQQKADERSQQKKKALEKKR